MNNFFHVEKTKKKRTRWAMIEMSTAAEVSIYYWE